MHHAAAKAAAHETINTGCMAHSATFGIAIATQTDEEWDSSMCRLCIEANQAWKDATEVIFSHLLKYDTQMAAFISATEGTLQAKCDEIWRHVHSLMDTAKIPHRICLPLALQTLDQLPAIPWDLSYHTGIPLMFTYSPELYNFQTWSAVRDGDYLLDNDAQATNLLSCKLVHMAGGVGPDDPSPIRAASPAGSAGSAMPLSPAHSPSRSHSRTPIHETEKERSCSSSTSSTHSQKTKPKSTVTSDSNDGDSASQEGNESEEKDEADSDSRTPDDSEGSDGSGSDGEGSGGGGKISDADGQEENADWETDESSSEAEESETESSSSSSESDDETLTKASPSMKKTPGSNPNTSQTLSLPNLDSKDLEEEWKIQWCKEIWQVVGPDDQ